MKHSAACSSSLVQGVVNNHRHTPSARRERRRLTGGRCDERVHARAPTVPLGIPRQSLTDPGTDAAGPRAPSDDARRVAADRGPCRLSRSRHGTGRANQPLSRRGAAFVFETTRPAIPRRRIDAATKNDERQRLATALRLAAEELAHLQEYVQAAVGETAGDIFDAHLGLLDDRQLVERVSEEIVHQQVNAEWTAESTIREFASALSSADNADLRERAALAPSAASARRPETERAGRLPKPVLDAIPVYAIAPTCRVPPYSTSRRDSGSATNGAPNHRGRPFTAPPRAHSSCNAWHSSDPAAGGKTSNGPLHCLPFHWRT